MQSYGNTGRGGSNHAPDPGLLAGLLATDTADVDRYEPPWPDEHPGHECFECGLPYDDDGNCPSCGKRRE